MIYNNKTPESAILAEIAHLQPQEPIIFRGLPSKHLLAYAASFPNHIYISIEDNEDIALLEEYASKINAVFVSANRILPSTSLLIRRLIFIETEDDLRNFKPEDGNRYDLVIKDYDLLDKVEQYSNEPLEYLEPGIAVARNRIYVHYLMKTTYDPFFS